MSFFERKQKVSPEEAVKKEAYLAYKKQARKGDAFAQFQLGECYCNGLGVEKNYEKAFEWYLKAANSGYPEAQYAVAECCEEGRGSFRLRIKENANDWYTRAAKQGFLRAQKRLAHLYYMNGCHNERFYWTCAAAEQGDSYSIMVVGRYYLFGTGGVEKNYSEAVKCFQKLIEMEKELANANCLMGTCYEYGYGVEKDPEKAFSHYDDAVKHGSIDAIYNLAKCYENGFGISQNIDIAIGLHTRNPRYGSSQYALGQIYYTGKGVEKDLAKAISYFEFAARFEHPEAQYMLGYLYYSGIGVPQDYGEAMKWLHCSKEKGNKNAAELLAKCKAEIEERETTPKTVSAENEIGTISNLQYGAEPDVTFGHDQVTDYGTFLEKQLSGTLTSQERDAFDRCWG